MSDILSSVSIIASVALVCCAGQAAAAAPVSGSEAEFAASRVVGRTIADSSPPSWPVIPRAPKGAPNVLLIMTDDVGFGATSTFGGAIPTPVFDALSQSGLRYNRFNTNGICSPTRASLLLGRYSHNVNMATVTNFATGYKGYNGVLPKSAGSIAEILKQNGYNTAAFGKWHLTTDWEESQTGPFDRWPTGLGFEYYFGFLNGDTSQFAPSLVENTVFIEPPYDQPDYIFDRDMADRALRWLGQQHQVAPDRPFFLYYAPGSAHAPHHAPREWLDKFRGKFDEGWDVLRQQTFERQKKLGIIPADTELTPRPELLAAWASLTADERKLYARLFEAFAAQLAYADYQTGRLIDRLRQSGQLENTLIVYIHGDNGGSAEGGPRGFLYEQSFLTGYKEEPAYMLSRINDIGGPLLYQNFPSPWAWATDAPFQYFKQISSHFGGIRNGMVVSWPGRIKQAGELRQQLLHVSDVMPTILEATGINAPASLNGHPQQPLDGISFTYSFDKAKAASRRRNLILEVGQNLAIYRDGWWAGTKPVKLPAQMVERGSPKIDDREWELYEVGKDFSQARNLAKLFPGKLRAMQQLFWQEARQNNILPLHDLTEGGEGRPRLADNRTKYVYFPGLTRVPHNAAPSVVGRSYSIEAEVVVPAAGASGVMVAQGGRFGGYSFYLKDGQPVFHYNALGPRQYRIAASDALAKGQHRLVADFIADSPTPGAGGLLSLSVDGNKVASGRIDHTLSLWISHTEGLDVGVDTLTPVTDDYSSGGSKFTAELKQVVFNLK